tara:strand:+ start:2875 stop:4083 length:1209 start_codon:yes stop_codon:yes gene_type:complete
MILTLGKNDSKLREFRKKVYVEDLNLDPAVMAMDCDVLYDYTKDKFEDAWKMSDVFWSGMECDQVWYIPGVALSCGYKYDDTRYRGCYLTYTLSEKRAKHRSLNFKEFGFMAMQAVRAAELGCKEIFLSVYEYDKRMSANIRALKHGGYGDIAGNILHQELEYKGVEKVRGVDQHIFSIDFEKLWHKYDEDLMELNNDEALPVIAKHPTDPRSYPDILKLNCDINLDKLILDYKNYNDNENYLLSRRKDLKISPSINMIIAAYLGFKDSVYHGVALNKKGTTELKDNVGEYTKNFLKQFPSGCRFNYVTTRKGWKTKQHVDHEDYTNQGFRIIVPFDEMRMTFDSAREYILKPGSIYFVNVAIPHVGDHYSSKEERAGLLFKLTNDEQIWQAYSSALSQSTV